MEKNKLFFALLFSLSIIFSLQANAQSPNCYVNVSSQIAQCASGTITSDNWSQGCRNIMCTSSANSFKVKACDKPGGPDSNYFELYRTLLSGTRFGFCLGNTCLGNSDFVRSQNFTVCNQPQPDPNDPGGSSSLTLISGTVNSQSVTSSSREVIVSPNESISGNINLDYTSTYGSNAVMAFGATPNWGDHASSYANYGSVNTPASGSKNVNLNFVAPSNPGTYYIIFAYRAEFTTGQVFSMTNWPVGNDVWNDGNDISDWTISQINNANSNGRAIGSILTTSGYHPFWVPATAIKITVTNNAPNFADPGYTSRLRFNSGALNGKSLTSLNRILTVSPGQSINGNLNFNYNSTYGSNAVMVFASTPNWGDHSSSCIYQGSVSTPGIGTLSANININAPTTPGTYHLLFQYRGEFTSGQVCSMTNWAAGNDVWNDGNDMSDWSEANISFAKSNGNTIATILHANGYRPWYVPADAIDIIVSDTSPPQISNGLPTGTLPQGTIASTVSVDTNEPAFCRISTTPGTAYNSMNFFNGVDGGTGHSTTVTGLQDGHTYTFYIKCKDNSGNIDPNDYAITFSVASSSNCSTNIKNIKATCTLTITQDTFSSGCRTLICSSGPNSLKVLACDKPNSINPTYFEMYKQATSGTVPKLCIANTCIQNNGYSKSQSYPICT